MMVRIKFLFICLVILISACDSNQQKGVWLPISGKFYQTPIELEEDSLNLTFVDYMGFTISIDSHFLSRGVIDQGVKFGDVINDTSIINELKQKQISSIKFYGDTLQKEEFEDLYDVTLTKEETYFIIHDNKSNTDVGKVSTSSNEEYEITFPYE